MPPQISSSFVARLRRDLSTYSETMLQTWRVMVLLSGLLASVAHAAPPDLAGHWQVDEDASDDPSERLKGLTLLHDAPRSKLKEELRRQGQARRLWVQQELNNAQARRAADTEAEVGKLAAILRANTLAIAPVAGGYEVTYDSGHTRQLLPRPGGPRYSAKGDEFVPNDLGRTMVYWRGNLLVAETILAPRGLLTEEFGLDAGKRRLKVHTVLKNPDWLLNADILRFFEPP